MSTTDDPVVVNEPPDDDVAIGESPDGDQLGGDQARWLLTNRRKVLIGLGTLGTIAAIAEADLGGSSGGDLYGGTMALDKAYKIGPRTYMGPDAIKDQVISEIPDEEGWRYEAPDTNNKYWLDNNSWQGPEGLGSSSIPAGPVHTESIENVADHIVDESDNDLDALFNEDLTGGETVFIGAGEYVYKNLKPSVDNVRLVGENPFTTTIKLSPDADGTSPTYDELFTIIDSSGWTVENLTFDGNKANVTDLGNMEDSFNCINVVNSPNVTVRNCRLLNNWANAIYLTNGSRDFEIINNYVENCTSGILCYNQWRSRSDATTRDGKIQGNTIIDLTDPQNNGPWGIYLSGKTTGVDVADNYVRNADNGIRINDVFKNNFTDNTLVDCYRAGIYFTAGAKDNKVEGNLIHCDPTDAGPVDGIYGTSNGSQDRNKVADNTIITPQRHGISFASGEDLIFENNEIVDPGGRGFSLNGPSSGRISDTVIIGPGQDSANIAIHINSGTFDIDGLHVRDTLGTLTRAVNFGGGSDHSLGGEIRVVGTDIVTNSVSGVTFKGVLGGGPLGGVDLTTVTGQHDGQEARSDGTATDFPTGTMATWDEAATQWVRADGQATV